MDYLFSLKATAQVSDSRNVKCEISPTQTILSMVRDSGIQSKLRVHFTQGGKRGRESALNKGRPLA